MLGTVIIPIVQMGKLRQGAVKNLPRVIQAELQFQARQQSFRVPSRSKPLPLVPQSGEVLQKEGAGDPEPANFTLSSPQPLPLKQKLRKR